MKRWTIQQECKERRYDILDDNGNPKSIKSDANVFNDIDYYGNKGSYQRAALFLDNTKMGGKWFDDTILRVQCSYKYNRYNVILF